MKIKENKEEKTIVYFWKSIKNLWSLIGKEKRSMVIVVIIMVFLTALDLVFPYILKLIIDEFPNMIELGGFNNYFICLLVLMFFIKI